MRQFIRLLSFSIYVLAMSVPAFAQNAQISGQVTDLQSAGVPKAEVRTVNAATGVERKTKTNDEGFYAVPFIEPGAYRVFVQAPGFQTAVSEPVTLSVGQTLVFNFQLKVGDVTQSVTVTDSMPIMNTTDGSVGTVVDREFIGNMPLNGRSFQALISLTPGVTISAASPQSQGQFSINGQRPNENYFTVDGVSANTGVSANGNLNAVGFGSGAQSTVTGGYNNIVSLDDMQEFRVETSTFAPEYGRLPGGQVIIVTRSGTNHWHGTAFDYLRNSVLDANNWFINANQLTPPAERQNDFGGTFGGPILKDKLFFFFSYEGLRLLLPQSTTQVVPSVAARLAAVPAMQPLLNGWPIPQVSCAPSATLPAACGSVADANLGVFSGAFSNKSNLDSGSLRLDWAATSKINLFVRGNLSFSNGTSRGNGSDAGVNVANFKTLTAGQTYLIRSNLTNDLRFNYSFSQGSNLDRSDNFGGATPIPNSAMYLPGHGPNTDAFFMFLHGVGVFFNGNGVANIERQYNVVNTTSWVHGPHQMKFGVDYRRLTPVNGNFPYRQVYLFSRSTASWVNDTPNQYRAESQTTTGLVDNNLGFFAQDSWKVRPRLTLTYGLRWDINPAPYASSGSPFFSLVSLDSANLGATQIAPLGSTIYKTQWTGIAPRIGVAYQLSQDPTWGRVVRGGFGIFYSSGGDAASFLRTPGGGVNQFGPATFPGLAYPVPPALTAIPPIQSAPPWTGVTTTNPNLRLPYSYQWNTAVEQMLGPMQSLTVTYVGSSGRNLLRTEYFNPPNTTLPDGFFVVNNDASSIYNALQAFFQRRLSRGLQATAAFTWSHCMDTGSQIAMANNTLSGLQPGLVPLNRYRGDCDFDIRDAFQTGVSYNIPNAFHNSLLNSIAGNWGTDFIFRARSAPPIDLVDSNKFFTPFPPGLVFPDEQPFVTVRPDIIPGVPLVISDPSAPGGKRLNPAAFVQAATGTLVSDQANLGRNALRVFGWNQVDFTLRRDFHIREALKLQFRADIFNLMNRPAFGLTGQSLNVQSPLFGRATSTLNASLGSGDVAGGYGQLYQIGGPRSIQLSLKLVF